jgi:hypothetical protein
MKHVARIQVIRKAYSILLGKPEGKKALVRARSKWKNNIKIKLKSSEILRCGLDSSGSRSKYVAGSCSCTFHIMPKIS